MRPAILRSIQMKSNAPTATTWKYKTQWTSAATE
jgi:hypothetical protein